MEEQQEAVYTAIQMGIGTVRIYDFDDIQLHAYETKDPFADESYLLETAQELIGLESPLFRDNLAEYTGYIKYLKKPLNHLIVAYHPAGGKSYADSRVYATETAQKSMGSGGSIRAMTDSFIASFGDKLDPEYPVITDTLKAGRITIGGVEFIVTDTKESFDLEIPAINVVYTHMAGAKNHTILESREQIEGMIVQMEDYWAKKYELILTAHDVPSSIEAAAEKIAYLKTIRTIAAKAADKASFIAAVHTAFPDYSGERCLEMSAGFLF